MPCTFIIDANTKLCYDTYTYIQKREGDNTMAQKYDRTMASVDVRMPWVLSLLCIVFIPLLPEYGAPPLALLSLVFAAKDAKRHHRRLRIGEVGKLILAFLCFMTVHMIWATERVLGTVFLGCWWSVFCSYLAATTILVSRQRIESALFLVSLISGILGALACVQYGCVAILDLEWFPLQVWDALDAKVYGLFDYRVYLHSLGTRAAATYSNPNFYAQYAVMTVPLVASYAFFGKRSAAKVVARLSLLFTVLGVFFSFSRGAYLAIGAIAIVMCMANIKRIVPILMVAFSLVMLLPQSIYDRLGSMGDASDVAISERFQVWGITMDAYLERPIFGHGIGIGAVWNRYYEQGFNAPHAHNLFLEFLVEGGVVALLILLFLLWKLFRIGFDLIIHAKYTRMYGSAVIAFCGGFCVCGMVDVPTFAPKTLAAFMLAVAMADAFSFLETKRPSLTFGQALPFANRLLPKIESWVKKKTAPKDDVQEEKAEV